MIHSVKVPRKVGLMGRIVSTYIILVKFVKPWLPVIVKYQNCFDHSESKVGL